MSRGFVWERFQNKGVVDSTFGGASPPVVDDAEPLPDWVLSDLPRNRAVIDRALVRHDDGSVWAVPWRQSGLGSAVYPLPKATLFFAKEEP